jgi:hypothetical protein
MKMVGHDHVGADVCAVLFSAMREFRERLMDFGGRQDRLSICGTGRHEANWKRWKDPVESPESFRT